MQLLVACVLSCVTHACIFIHFSNVQYQDIRQDKLVCYKGLKNKTDDRMLICRTWQQFAGRRKMKRKSTGSSY